MKVNSIILIVAAGLLLSSCGIQTQIKRADKRYAIGEYYAASEQYKKIYQKLPTKDKKRRGEIAFKQGECYWKIGSNRAASAYANAIKCGYKDSIVYLRHAQAAIWAGKLKDAQKSIDHYLELAPEDSVAHWTQESITNMSQLKAQKSRYKVTEAKELNARRASTFCPVFVGGDDVLAFTSNRKEKSSDATSKPSSINNKALNNLYTIRRNQQGKWEDAEKMEGLSTDNDEGVCTFTADGKTIYFSRAIVSEKTDKGAEIYTSQRAGGSWGEATFLKLFEDSTITVGHPTISADGTTIYFVSDAPGGYGGLDIYQATQEDGKWLVENMGPSINTSEDEMFPYLRANGDLYFSSRGRGGLGGLDLFVAHADTTGGMHWIVSNMGKPFNSENDDFGICFSSDAEHENGYFSSNRQDKKAYDKLYYFELPELVYLLQGTVTDTHGDAVTTAYIRVIGNDGLNTRVQVKKDGSYKVKLNPDAKYVMLCTARGYLNVKESATTMCEYDSKTYTQDFQLASIMKPVKMDNIFYEFGKWTLTADSEKGLLDLVKLLNDNPNITIELGAHTDMVGSDELNRSLSEKRAQSVVDFLVKHGIERARLQPVGYGETQPVTVDASLHKKYGWLPVGQQLTPEYIENLKAEQQEICNQINRRTEFRVLSTTYKLY